jgi:nitroreductase
VTVSEVLDGHGVLDLACLDRDSAARPNCLDVKVKFEGAAGGRVRAECPEPPLRTSTREWSCRTPAGRGLGSSGGDNPPLISGTLALSTSEAGSLAPVCCDSRGRDVAAPGRVAYNIVAAAKPATDRDRHQRWHRRRARRCRTSRREVDVETWDAIRSRRNVRSYGKGAIAPQDLDRILEAARRTPSAGNQQAWDFVVCTDREQLTQLARVWRAARHVASSAATIALVAPRSDDARTRDLIQFDLGQATMSVMLAAADLGIGSAHAGVGDQELARRLLGIPEDRFCGLLIALGVPADRPLTPIQRPDRRPFEEVVHRGHW